MLARRSALGKRRVSGTNPPPFRPPKRPAFQRIPRSIPLSGFPATQTVRLKYCTEIALNPPSGATQTHNFSANGMFDPDVTGIGHQPKGFDNWTGVYRHYTVIASKIKVTPVSTDGTAGLTGFYFGVGTTTGTIDYNGMSPTTIMESANATSYKFINHFTTSGADNYSAVKAFWSGRKVFGRNVLGASQFSGSSGANPDEQSFFTVWAGSVNGNDPGNVNYLVEIEYIAVFAEKIPLAQS